MKITLKLVRDKWWSCPGYPAALLAALYPVPRTAVEVLTMKDGPWAEVPAADRLCTVLRKGVLSNRVLRLSACDCAERALNRERDAGREPHPYYWNAVAVAKQFALGNATAEEMYVARAAACTAVRTVRAGRNSYLAEAYTAAAARAAAAADAADTVVASIAATAAEAATTAAATERRTQVDRLLTIIAENA